MVNAGGAHSSRFALPTYTEKRKLLQAETIVDSGCVRAAAETARAHTDVDLLFLFIGRSRPHLSDDKRTQLPLIWLSSLWQSRQTGKTGAHAHLSPGVPPVPLAPLRDTLENVENCFCDVACHR